MRITSALLTLLLLVGVTKFQVGQSSPQAAAAPETEPWIKLTFGLDEKPVPWDGQARVENGKILQSAPWCFEKRDRFDPVAHKWFCTTVYLAGRKASSFAEPARGVLLQLKRQDKTAVTVETKQGNFTVDVALLRAGTPQLFLDGRASVELLGSSKALPNAHLDTDLFTEDDFPSLVIDKAGHRWIAWIGYEENAKRDHLWVLDVDDANAKVTEILTAREQLDPQLVADENNNLWLFWAAPQGDNWDLWASQHKPTGWSAAKRVTTAAGTDFQHCVARGPKGEIWLAWQAFRSSHSDIFVRRLKNGQWSNEIAVAQTAGNQWEPSISIDSTGRAWIAYDSYQNGNYDVFLTSLVIDENQKATQGETIGIATTANFEAHANVLAGDNGKVWVAYDAAGKNWGKDFTRDITTYREEYAEPLHAQRHIELRAVLDGRVMKPTDALPQKFNQQPLDQVSHNLPSNNKRFYEIPQLARDGNGRLWLFFRVNRQGYAGHPKMGGNWEIFATTFDDGRWIEPILLPLSTGRQDQRVSTAIDSHGRLQAAWSTGHHLVDRTQKIRFGTLPNLSGKIESPPLQPVDSETAVPTSEPIVRSWKMHRQGETYEVYFGDLHRHTDISLCTPTIDGCLVDAYRYALDAVKLDFLAVTDHTRDTDPFPWWRTQKANDLFRVSGTFSPIYGYERSNSVAGGGHRNVFFLERDWPVLRSDAHYSGARLPRPENNNPDVALYPHLRGKNAITAAHTPGYQPKAMRGTWTYNDPQVEPIAEIIQSYRRDYLQPGKPQWPESRLRSTLREEASLWYALARGYKLGFIASSDHHATHTSFACVWAKGPERADIFEALRSRRTYAATDKILLEVRMGNAVMGEEIEAPEVPELTIHVRGTADIEEIQIVRNRTVVFRSSPKQREVEMSFRDDGYPGGAAYYYVRVRQSDNNMAWGSPIWVK